MPFTTEKDVNIYYEANGSGTPLVFIHPPGMSHATFVEQHPLAKSCQLILIDLPGNGYSTKLDAVSMENLTRYVLAVLERLGLEQVVIAGYSNGGSIAQEFALRYPERTAGLILIGGFSEVSSFVLENQFKLGIWGASKQLIPLFAFILSRGHFKQHAKQKSLSNMIMKTDPQTLKMTYEAGLAYRSTKRLAAIHVPLLLVYGNRDFHMHSYALDFCQQVKDIELVYVSGVAHQVPTKRPNEANHVITNWLKRKKL